MLSLLSTQGFDAKQHTFDAPLEIILGLFKKRYPEGPDLKISACRVYYERCLTKDSAGNLVVVYFPPAFNYVMDTGLGSLIIFKTCLQSNIVGDPTFPHWDQGEFFAIRTEQSRDIIYPFKLRDLIISTKSDLSMEVLSALAKPLGIEIIDQSAACVFLGRAPALHEDKLADMLRALPEISYVERNSMVRIIDIYPGWTLDRVF